MGFSIADSLGGETLKKTMGNHLSSHSRVLIVWVSGLYFLGRREEDSGEIGRAEEVSSGGAAVKEYCRPGRSNHVGSCSHQEERDGMGGRGTSPRLSLPRILRDW